MPLINKDTLFIAALVLIVIIGIAIYDYQVRKIMADTIKRIATMGNLKKVVKSPITAFAIFWAWIWNIEKE